VPLALLGLVPGILVGCGPGSLAGWRVARKFQHRDHMSLRENAY
jgi:hypothetical protein